jgi:HPr kinase/phosphorylase
MTVLTVKKLYEQGKSSLNLNMINGENMRIDISNSLYYRAGIHLTGVKKDNGEKGIILFGKAEISFFENLSEDEVFEAVNILFNLKPACFIFTRNLKVPEKILNFAKMKEVSVFTTTFKMSEFIIVLGSFINEHTCETIRIHGALIDVMGIGILIIGKSGVGKSEAALDLISRNHRLVADDIVEISKYLPNLLVGKGIPVIRHHMEIRGLGIISIPSLYGPSAVRESKKIEMVIRMENWRENKEYERLGMEELRQEYLGVEIPLLEIPVKPGRSMGTIIEVAARDRLLKLRGINSSEIFQEKFSEELTGSKLNENKDMDYNI